MKIFFASILICLLSGCNYSYEKACKMGFPEKHYDFLTDIKRQPDFDYLEAIIDFRQFGSYSKNLWIRKAKNLELVYGSVKQIGLKKFISEKEFNQQFFTDHWAETCWENKSLNQINKNLISSYSDTTGFDLYYIQFWKRRKIDNNDSITLEILKDVDNTYNPNKISSSLNWKTDPIITKLFDFEIKLESADSSNVKKINIEYFKYLKEIGLYSSATNFIREKQDEVAIKDNEYEKLINKIETDSVNCQDYWEWRTNAKWFSHISDYEL